MKKIISLLLILCMVFTFVACDKDSQDSTDANNETSDVSGKTPDENRVPDKNPELPHDNNYKTAVWDGYEDTSFVEFLNIAMEKYKESEPDVEAIIHDISIEKGWKSSDTLDKSSDLSEGCEAITYIIDATEDGVNAEIYVFMEYNESENTVSVKGGMVLGNSYTKEETEYSLNVGKALLVDGDSLKEEVRP